MIPEPFSTYAADFPWFGWYDPYAHPERHGLVPQQGQPEPFDRLMAIVRAMRHVAALKASSKAYREVG